MGTVNMNFKGLIGHQGGGEQNFNIKGVIEFSVLQMFKGGWDCLITYDGFACSGRNSYLIYQQTHNLGKDFSRECLITYYIVMKCQVNLKNQDST